MKASQAFDCFLAKRGGVCTSSQLLPFYPFPGNLQEHTYSSPQARPPSRKMTPLVQRNFFLVTRGRVPPSGQAEWALLERVPLFSARCAQIRVINIERKFGRQNCVVCPPETPPPKLSPGIEPADATRQLPGVGMKQRSWFLFTPQPNTPIGVGATTLSVWCVCLSGVGGLAGLWVDVCMVV